MGWDVKATADSVLAAVDSAAGPTAAQVTEGAQTAANQVGAAIAAHPGSFISYTLASIILMSLAGLLWRVKGRIAKVLEETMFSNWRLALLGTTGIVLSLASGYTTWDGMRNFTGEGVLSLMVTFGIQGVMLIAAWLIGESFAIGMNQQASRPTDRGWHGLSVEQGNVAGALIGIALFIAIAALVTETGPAALYPTGGKAFDWGQLSNKLLIIVTGLLAVAFVAVFAASDLIRPYIQSFRVVVKNSVLWVMFLSCMATSVFFSFDSLFSAIFPQSERVRAAELRAQNQVAGIVADIEQKITETRLEEAQQLFSTPGWQGYEKQTSELIGAAKVSAGVIEKFFNDQIEERNRAIKQQQERITTAQGGQAGLAGKKVALADELTRLKSDRPGLAAEYGQKKSDVEAKSKEVDAKRVEAMAEAGGVEGTGKEGHGPVYRQRMEELAKLQAAVKIAEERANDAKERLNSVETRITAIEREQSALDGDLAKLKGEAETAEQRIKLTQEQLPGDSGARIDPSRITPAFEAARATFRQEPTQKGLAELQQYCSQIQTAMNATPATRKMVASVDCDPKAAAEAASVVFALNAGTEVFGKSCKGGEKLAQYTSADALFGFARKCLADSGLPSKETDQLRTKINFIELNRDDKAHRFVVTWNAFQDGNRLAYLALAIAIAIDALVFMSGLFGANAVRSPLSDVPSRKARSAKQLESTINAALGELPYDTAGLVLSAMKPITNTDGFSGMITLDGVDKLIAVRIREVLTAGSDIHAVETIGQNPERYRVRGELAVYLRGVREKHFKSNPAIAMRAELGQKVAEALLPHIHEHADITINNLHPMKPKDGFTSSVSLAALDAYDARVVRRVINAAGAFGAAAPDVDQQKKSGIYYFRPDLIHVLQTLLAHTPRSVNFEADRQRYFRDIAARANPAAIEGGALNAGMAQVPPPVPQRKLQGPDAGRLEIPMFMQAAGPARNDEANDGARQREFVAGLIAAIGIEPGLFYALSGPSFGAAAAASEAFSRARNLNGLLDTELTQRDEEARMALDNGFYALESTLAPGDSLNRQRLKAAYDDVDQNWAILMLMPGGPYERLLVELIVALEPDAADGNLPPREQALLFSARQLRQALGANSRNSPQAWQQLDQALQGALAPGQHAAAQPGSAGTPGGGGKRTLQ